MTLRRNFSMMKKINVLLGADPELFVVDNAGRPRSAHGLVPGTKESPHKVKCGAVQVDGMALEFNIDPAKTENEFVGNIKTVMKELRKMTPEEFKFHIKPSVRFHGNHLRTQPDEAKELGCMPDFNVYTMAENPRPDSNTTLRTASGHIHIGVGEPVEDPNEEMHVIRCATLAKHLDLFLGLRSLEWDADQTRRKLYGNPGAIRLKPYGLEYRVLSNQWLENENLIRFVYKQTMACIADLMKNGSLTIGDYDNIAKDITSGRRYYSKYKYMLSAKAKAAIEVADSLKIGAK
jgi:hypothetical protein